MTNFDHSASQQAASENAAQEGAVTPDLLAQLANTLWLPHDMDEGTRGVRLAAARAMLADINPAAGIEGMLACQMVATHEAAMACLSRSAAPDQSPEQTDQNLKHAERLMALYTRQVDVLGRHRIRQQERQEQLDRQHRDEERRAEIESIHAQWKNDSDWEDEDEDEDDVYADDHAGVYADTYVDAYADRRNGNGANGNGANGNGANEGLCDPDPGEP